MGPVNCSPPGSTVHGILQARILEPWPSLLQRNFPIQGSNPSLPRCRQVLYQLSPQGGGEEPGGAVDTAVTGQGGRAPELLSGFAGKGAVLARAAPAAAAAKSLWSCPPLCDPIDGSPPDSSLHGILQARTLEWAAISFSRRCIHKGANGQC